MLLQIGPTFPLGNVSVQNLQTLHMLLNHGGQPYYHTTLHIQQQATLKLLIPYIMLFTFAFITFCVLYPYLHTDLHIYMPFQSPFSKSGGHIVSPCYAYVLSGQSLDSLCVYTFCAHSASCGVLLIHIINVV